MRTRIDSPGAGQYRGGPATEVQYGPRFADMTVINITSGRITVPRGVRGGHSAGVGGNFIVSDENGCQQQPAFMQAHLAKGQKVLGLDQGGGGFGSPLRRDPHRVLQDVEDGFVTRNVAADTYGVLFQGLIEDDTLAVDAAATLGRRASLAIA